MDAVNDEPFLLPSPSDKIVSEDTASKRAFKAEYGLSKIMDKTAEEFFQDFLAGKEQEIREQAATELDRRKASLKLELLTAVSRKMDRSLTPEEAAYITDDARLNPNTVIEEQLAEAYTKYLDDLSTREDTDLTDAKLTIPQQLAITRATANTALAKHEIAQTALQDMEDEVQNQSWLGWGVDQLKSLVPLVGQAYYEAKLRGNVEGVSKFHGLIGTNLTEQARYLYASTKTPTEFREKLYNILNTLKADNPSLARTFAQSVAGQSTSDEAMENLFTLIGTTDIVPAVGIGKSVAKEIRLQRTVNQAFKDVVKGAAVPDVSKSSIAEAAGDVSEAAVQKVTSDTLRSMKGTSNPGRELMEDIPSVMKSDILGIEDNPGRLSQGLVAKLKERTEQVSTNLMNIISNIQRIERIPAVVATEKAIRAIQKSIKEEFTANINSNILDISKPRLDPTHTHYEVDVLIGKPGNELWFRKEQAEQYAHINGLRGAHVVPAEQKGLGYYIKVTKPLDETKDVVRDWLVSTKEAKMPEGSVLNWANALLGWVRTPEETMALEQRMARKIAAYAPSKLLEVAKDSAKEIQELAKHTYSFTKRRERWNDWKRVIENARNQKDVDGNVLVLKTPMELDELYLKTVNRLPDEAETAAYFSYIRTNEIDRVYRNLKLYENMKRVGAEQHRFYVLDRNGGRVYSDYFVGMIRKDFPGGEDTILVLGDRVGDESIYYGGSPRLMKVASSLRESVQAGNKIVLEIYDPELRPLTGFGKVEDQHRVRFIIADKIETKPIVFDQLPRRGGGHFEYDTEWYIKQARVVPERLGNVFKHWYEGDTTIMPISIRAMGEDIVNKLNTARELLLQNKKAEAKQFVETNLPIEWKEFNSWFTPKKDPNGVIRHPRLTLKEPFQVVQRDKLIVDMDRALERRYEYRKPDGSIGSTFNDGTKRGSVARQYQVQYTGQRDAYDVFTFRNEGTKDNPLYRYEPARLVDPITAMNRGLSRISNSHYMDNYKIMAVEHWLREASQSGVIVAEESALRSSPFYYFHHPQWKQGADKALVNRFKINHFQIRQFLGQPSTTEAILHSIGQRLADSLYGTKFQIDPSWMLSKVSDPLRFIRSVTFHAKLGLFAVPQILVQSQTYTTIWGIAGPKYAAPGTLAAMLHQFSRINKNPAVLNKMDSIASKLGWKAGEWKEAMEELNRTGFGNVGGEFALRDDIMSHKVISTGGTKFLDAGAWFFTEGERNVRYGAWYTAFKEYRAKNPTGRITNTERKQILERADLLYVNMSRASSSPLHQGILSIPTQFLSYQMRAAELFTGKRLTWTERARLLGAYSLMYGVPTSLAATGFPASDYIRKYAIENGYVPGDGKIVSTFMEGVPALILALTTGNWYNVGERYGAQGFETIREAFRGDRTLWDIIGGAAFSTFANTVTQSDGFMKAMVSLIKGDDQFKLKVEDFVDIFKEITSVNTTWRSIAAINTGNWYSKKGVFLEKDISTLNSIFMGLTGLSPTGVSDLSLMAWTRKDEKELQQYGLNKFIIEMRRGLESQYNKDYSQAQDYFKRAMVYLEATGYPREKLGQAFSLAFKDREPLIERSIWDFGTKNVPEDKQDVRREFMLRSMKKRQEKGE